MSILYHCTVNPVTKKTIKCGIPIIEWMYIFFILLAIRALCNLLRLLIINRNRNQMFMYEVFRMIVVDGIIILWLLYGHSLYFSNENNCGLEE
jgi:hypothetical protein